MFLKVILFWKSNSAPELLGFSLVRVWICVLFGLVGYGLGLDLVLVLVLVFV